jgi:anaerobic ribonucleoside-triphosphate reductase
METQKQKLNVLSREEIHEEAHRTGASCPFCGSDNVYGISRVVGYYSPIDNWNLGKKAEFEARQIGDYKL